MPLELFDKTPLVALIAVPVLVLGLWLSLADRPRGRWIASWVLRVAGVVLLILALCRPYMALPSEAMHVAFLVDVSESVDLDATREAVADVERAIDGLRAGDTWSLFALGRGLRAYDTPAALREELERWEAGAEDDRFRSATRIGEALAGVRLAMPAGKARRVVLHSDGKPTDATDVDDVLRALREEGIEVRFAEVAGLAEAEASVVSVASSTREAFEGETVRLTMTMASNTTMPAELRILNRGAVVTRRQVQLEPGADNRAELDVMMRTPGPSVWTAELVPERDHFPINNQVRRTIHVQGQPRLLVLHEQPREMRELSRALQRQQFSVDVRPSHGLPTTMTELLAFDAVVLAAVPARELGARQMQLLKRYVADFGGGLMMLGSEQSFGLGGYYRTPVEDVLPLVSRFERERERPSLAMTLVIDKSGSMSGVPIALARQAAKASVEMLSPRDEIGVVAFDNEAYIISEMRPATQAEAVKQAIDQLGAGGGTFMYAGMDAARTMLEATSARIKHMIILGDGMTLPADHFGLINDLNDLNVTVSTVALGNEADRQLLAAIAERGGGRYYETLDPDNVPQIFTRETMQASRSAIREDVFSAVQVADHPALAGFEDQALPPTFGYVMTQAKPTARVLLAMETGDPLLAVMRYGLGTGMAYTSNLGPRWGAAWLGWPGFSAYWAQVFRSLIRNQDHTGIVVRTDADEHTWRVRITRRDEVGRPVVGVNWAAEIVDEQGGRRPVRVEEGGLGEYRATVPLAEHRRLTLRLHDRDHDKLRAVHYDRPYPREYRLEDRVPEAIAALPRFNPDTIHTGLEPARRRRPVMPGLVIAAMTCLIAGLVLRRI